MTETPPNYYALSRPKRDHLLAAAQLQDGASGQDIQRQVETLREVERPSNNSTYGALDSLREWGWVEKTDGGYAVTKEGRDVLTTAKVKFSR